MAYIKPAKGNKRNPIYGAKRNAFCPCISGKKVKKCCGRFLYIKDETYEKIIAHLDKIPKDKLKEINVKY